MVDPAATGGVGGALAAAAAPLTKLVETISAGLGRVYEPTHQRRMAKAEGDKMVILATAANEVTDLQRRAAERWLAVEAIRQQNIEAIADKASSELPATVGEAPVEPGWTAKFFDSCKDVSQEDMQAIWAKLLAGEVASPGAFSLRTLQVLATLSPSEAKLFDKLCSLLMHEVGPFIFDEREEALRSMGLDFSARHLLVQAGLIQVHSFGVKRSGHHGALFMHPVDGGPVLVGLPPNLPAPTEVQLGTVLLTEAGKELSKLWRGDVDAAHLDWLLHRFRSQGWQMDKMHRRRTGEGFSSDEMPEFMARFIKSGGLKDSTF